MASIDIIKENNAGSFGKDSAPYLISEMKFLSNAGGHIGKAINILVILLESSELWRETSGSELDLGAKILEDDLNETISNWERKTTNIFALSPFYLDRLRECIATEAMFLREALFLEHFGLNKTAAFTFFRERFLCENPRETWEMQDFSEFIVEALNLAQRLTNRKKKSKTSENFVTFMKDFDHRELLSHKSRLADASSIDFSAIINNSAHYRIMYFENQKEFLTLTPVAVEFKDGLSINGLKRSIKYNGYVDHRDEELTFLFQLNPLFTASTWVPAQKISSEHLDEVRFYAAMKSPIHLLILYGGIVLYNDAENYYRTLFVFDRGCDILLSPPMKTSAKFDKFNPVIFNEDNCLSKDGINDFGNFFKSVNLDPIDKLHYYGPKQHLVKNLFGLVVSSENNRSDRGNNLFWQFNCLIDNVYRITKPWKQISFLSNLMIAIETSHDNWISKDGILAPIRLRDFALSRSWLN